MVVSEIGNYRLTREALKETHYWEKPGAGRIDTPRGNFYLDGICMPMPRLMLLMRLMRRIM